MFFARLLLTGISLMVLSLGALAQRTKIVKADAPLSGVSEPTAAPPSGLLYVSQRIDLQQQLSADEAIYSLDGEPLPKLQTISVTLGLVIDNQGHIITRLANASPQTSSAQISVYTQQNARQINAKFIGMDSVTGLCLLQAEMPNLPAVKISPAALKAKEISTEKIVRIFGFNPNQRGGRPGVSMIRPRIHVASCSIKRALSDFRYNPGSPIYYLKTFRPLTEVQDCSLIVEEDGSVFGLVAFDVSGEGAHLVYPLNRLQRLAAMIQANRRTVIPHAWLGATGENYKRMVKPANSLTPEEKGVLIAMVFPDSPAEIAGILPQDRLLSISGRNVTTGAELRDTLQLLPADSEVTLRVRRNSVLKTLQAKLVPSPAANAKEQLDWMTGRLEEYARTAESLPENDPRRTIAEKKRSTMDTIVRGIYGAAPLDVRLRVLYGIEVMPLTSQLAKYLSVEQGVLVSTVASAGKAQQAGIKAGDVILNIGEQNVSSVETFVQALNDNKDEALEIQISRRGQGLKLKMTR